MWSVLVTMTVASSLRCIIVGIVFMAILGERNDEIFSSLKDGKVCPSQPMVVDQLLKRPGIPKDIDCIFMRLSSVSGGGLSYQSSLVISENDAVPDKQGWSRCQNCGWRNDKFAIFSSGDNSTQQPVSLSWSLWGEFFFRTRNDQYQAEIKPIHHLAHILETSGDGTSYYIDRPVYILPMITFHVGHILIDVLEQVYRSMMSTYGQIRLDTLIVVDVASEDERAVLQEKLYLNIFHPTVSSFGSILTLLTSLPVLSMKVFNDLSKEGTFVLFKDVHLGLDNSETYFYRGFDIHPMVFPTQNQSKSLLKLAENYIKFRDFIQDGTSKMLQKSYQVNSNVDSTSTAATDASENESLILKWANERVKGTVNPSIKILFVQREKNRVILNINRLEQIAELHGSVLGVNELGNVPFNDQLLLFHHTDVLVAMAGTALHNMLFMRPGTSVIILMQPDWCDWAWMYANQAVLLGINYYIYCANSSSSLSSNITANSSVYPESGVNTDESDESSYKRTVDIDGNTEELSGFHWTRKFWLQGPRTMKSENATVDEHIFTSLLGSALEAFMGFGGHSNILTPTENPVHGVDIGDKGVHTVLKPDVEVSTSSEERTAFDIAQQSKILEVFISSIKIEVVEAPIREVDGERSPPQIAWRIAILGEFVSAQGRVDLMAASMPHLVICVRSLLSVSVPWCSALEGVNYYSDIFLTFTESVQTLHLWAQVSELGGKIKGSDLYYSLDAAIPDGGSKIHMDSIGLTLRDTVEMESGVLDPITGRKQLVRVVYEQYISDRYALQRSIINFCSTHKLNDLSCGLLSAQLSAVAYKAVQMRRINLPDKQYLPTPERPLVFVHIEKTGGTTLREFIAESADKLGIKYFIPCHGGIHCVTLSLTEDIERKGPGCHEGEYLTVAAGDMREEFKNVSIVAGHFFWDVWQHLPSALRLRPIEGTGVPLRGPGVSLTGQVDNVAYSNNNSAPSLKHTEGMDAGEGGGGGGGQEEEVKAVPPCIVIGRHPIERAISYYYQRCYRSEYCVGHKKLFNDLTIEELSSIIKEKRSGGHKSDNATTVVLDEGLEDAACRALANEKSTTGLIVGMDELIFPPPLSSVAVARALDNSEKCVVGILERWDETKEVLKFWFPWLDFSEDSDRRRMFFSSRETIQTVRPDLAAELLRVNSCDMRLYDKMLGLFEAELSVIRGDPFNAKQL